MAKKKRGVGRPTNKDKRYENAGRPSIMTEKIVEKIEVILQNDGTIEEACRYAGIHRDTYYKYKKENDKFSDRMEQAMDYPNILARKTLMQGIAKGEWRASVEYLKRRDKRYKDKIEDTGGQAISVYINNPKKIDGDDVDE